MIDDPSLPNDPASRDRTSTPAGELPGGWTLLEGQYTIQHVIASGGFGITYLARDRLERDVAIKECFPLGLAQRDSNTRVVSAASAGTEEHFGTARAQFLREARMLAALDHPNVVRVQTLFEENGTAYMAMDFIHGRDLQEEIVAAGTAGLQPTRVLELAKALLGALDYVHGTGLLHRDVKPQNIRIDRFGVPMLIDFGAARAETQERSRLAGSFQVVTDGYSPHEFYVSGTAQGPHSDLYALAATLFHVITGAAPVSADKRAAALSTGGTDPYMPIAGRYPKQDGRLLTLIDRAMAMVPGDRPENASVWLTALADAPTTIVAPMAEPVAPAAPPTPSRFVPGLLVGAALVAAIGGGIWAVQPAWLSPGMDEMMARMGALEEALAVAEAARADAETQLAGLNTTLTESEAELARLEAAADGDMAATMEELAAARTARDDAAASVAALEEDLAALAATQAALEEAQAERDAAQEMASRLSRQAAADVQEIQRLTEMQRAADARIRELEAELQEATRALTEAREEAARLAQVQADLTEAETALYDATTRASALEEQLAEALDGAPDLDQLRRQLQDLEGVLSATEAERDRLAAQIASMSSSSDANAGQLERLRERLRTLEAENLALAEALARAGGALNLSYTEGPILRAPNGVLAVLPRFSWDNSTVAIADTSGGISVFDRDSGVYQGHLARGIPDPIRRLDFSVRGGYLIATTEAGRPDRLYSVAQQREILSFEANTVTSAGRAISLDERWFLYTREGFSGRSDVIVVDLQSPQLTERLLTWASAGSNVRVAFAETTTDIVVVRDDAVEVYTPQGQLRNNVTNSLGAIAAISPIADDQGILVLRADGEIAIFEGPVSQTLLSTAHARATYTTFRLSGDRTRFIRANAEVWDVTDLITGGVVASGRLPSGYGDAELGLSTDGRALFIGAVGSNPARLISVETGEELQRFGQAAEGYFSFDGDVIVTGTEGTAAAQLWRLSSAAAAAIPDPVIAPLTPAPAAPDDTAACAARMFISNPRSEVLLGSLETGQSFFSFAGGEIDLRACENTLRGGLVQAMDIVDGPLHIRPEPSTNVRLRGAVPELVVRASIDPACDPRLIVSYEGAWYISENFGGRHQVTLPASNADERDLAVWASLPVAGQTCQSSFEIVTNR